MSKVIFYRFYTLEDLMAALSYIEREAKEYEEKIPGLTTECVTSVSERDYFIEMYIRHEDEDE